MAKTATMASGKCACSPGYFIGAVVLMALGIWALVQGFIGQWNYASVMSVLPWYFLGALIVAIGKFFKFEACRNCPVHGWKR